MSARRHSSLWRTQNFLARPAVIDPVIDASGIGAGDLVIDIGAGLGAITRHLSATGARVLAIERDPRLCAGLRERFAGGPRVTVICGDFLDVRLPRRPYKVFASPPFDVITSIVTKLTEAATPPDDVFLAMQREAADRYRGWPAETLYALLLQPWFVASIVHRFSRNDFTPRPGVDVVMLRLRKRGPPLVARSERQLYRDFVVACFTAWQPSIGDALARIFASRVAQRLLAQVDLDPRLRPTTVRFASWLELFRAVAQLPLAARSRLDGAERRLRAQQAHLQKRHRTRAPRDDPPRDAEIHGHRRPSRSRSNAAGDGRVSSHARMIAAAPAEGIAEVSTSVS